MQRIYLRAVQYQADGMPLPNSHQEYAIAGKSEATHHADFGDGETVPTVSGGPPTCRTLLAGSVHCRVAEGV